MKKASVSYAIVLALTYLTIAFLWGDVVWMSVNSPAGRTAIVAWLIISLLLGKVGFTLYKWWEEDN